MDIAKEIRERRLKLGLTQAQLAERINMRVSYVSDMEHSRRKPSIQTLQPFLDALGGELQIKWHRIKKQ